MDKVQKFQLAEIAAVMRDLKQSSGWACYEQVMRDMLAAGTESVLQADPKEFEYRKGRVHGLREALQLPDLIINRSKQG